MIPRLIEKDLKDRLHTTPAVALLGPRQCGKTTLAQSLGGIYYDLEQPADRLRLDLDWEDRLRNNQLLILDEAQSSPELFPRLRGAIDSDRKRNGRFLLLGSVSPAMMVKVSESLAGRLSLLELTPFLRPELPSSDDRSRLWSYGGFPDGGVLQPGRFLRWQHDYLTLLVQRSLPTWGLPAKPQAILHFLKMIAAVHGQSWNASQLGASLGLDHKTINSYLDFLVGSFLVRRLLPYQANIKKRLVKTPKVFWRDTGLLHALLNLPDEKQLIEQPWVGASWEGFVIEQALGLLSAAAIFFEAYYFRTSDQHEIDLVLDTGNGLTAIEIKLTSSPSPADMDRLNHAADLLGAKRRILVSQTPKTAGNDVAMSCNLDTLLQLLPTWT